MAIEKRGKGSWRLTLSVQGPSGPMLIRETVHVDPSLSEARQRREAEKAYALLLLRFDAGEVAPPRPAHTLRSWAETWLSTCIAPNCSPVTLKNDRHLLDSRILPELGDLAKLRGSRPRCRTLSWPAGTALPRISWRRPRNGPAPCPRTRSFIITYAFPPAWSRPSGWSFLNRTPWTGSRARSCGSPRSDT